MNWLITARREKGLTQAQVARVVHIAQATYANIELHKRKGVGTALMRKMERRVKEFDAIVIQLEAVNDDNHDRFYGRLGYGNATNNVLKSKMMQE